MFIGKKLYWRFQIVGWLGFFLFQYFLLSYQGGVRHTPQPNMFLTHALCPAIIGFFVSHIIRIFTLRLNILAKKLLSQIFWFVAFVIISSFISSVLEVFFLKFLNTELPMAVEHFENGSYIKMITLVVSNGIIWCLYYFIWSTLYLMYHYIIMNRKQEIDTLKLKTHVKELELKTIKTHINPHFIFNALNGIRAMVDENPQRAREAITELSNILRSSINIDKWETVPLTDELNIIKDYLALEQMRFEDRLMVTYDISDDTTGQHIPPMILQMLVENAIKHGISKEINGGLVKITSNLSENFLVLTVENSGRLEEQKHNGGFGIKSINERLKLMYADSAHFQITQSAQNIVTATLKLPLSNKTDLQ